MSRSLAKDVAHLLLNNTKNDELSQKLEVILETVKLERDMKRVGTAILNELDGAKLDPSTLNEVLTPLSLLSDAWTSIIDDLLLEQQAMKKASESKRTQGRYTMKDTPDQISSNVPARTGAGSVTMRKPERQPKVQIQVESEGDLGIEPDQDSREADGHKRSDPESGL